MVLRPLQLCADEAWRQAATVPFTSTLEGRKLQEVKSGRPAQERLTKLLKPGVGLMVTATDPGMPASRFRVAGVAVREKSGAATCAVTSAGAEAEAAEV